MTQNTLAALLLIGLGALGCSRPQFTYDVPSGIIPQKFKTIAIDPRTDRIFLIEGKRQLRDPEIQSLVRAGLQAKGYRLVAPDQADLWVNALLLISSPRFNKENSESHGNSHGGGSGLGHSAMGHGRYSGGSDSEGGHAGSTAHSGGSDMAVLVELVARISLERVWAGTGEVALSKDASGHHNHPPLSDTVGHLLEPLQARPSSDHGMRGDIEMRGGGK